MPKRRILIAYTGGTIGMAPSAEGYAPDPGAIEKVLTTSRRFGSKELPDYELHTCEPLLDSADMQSEDWVRIARVIEENYAEFDGFLVLHGTDTLAYTASALSFMLEGLAKPVFLTGSQIPLLEARNDAQDNLLTSMVILEEYAPRIAEVCVYFDDELLRGNRVTKVDAESFHAFASPNLPLLGRAGVEIDLRWDLVRAPADPPKALDVQPIGGSTVASFRIFPGLQADYLEAILKDVQGLVLEVYGAGTAPSKNPEILNAFRCATERGVVVVAVPQPLRGTADLSGYATGQSLSATGVISGYDMTAEAALAKLSYLLDTLGDPGDVRAAIGLDLRGELTLPHPED